VDGDVVQRRPERLDAFVRSEQLVRPALELVQRRLGAAAARAQLPREQQVEVDCGGPDDGVHGDHAGGRQHDVAWLHLGGAHSSLVGADGDASSESPTGAFAAALLATAPDAKGTLRAGRADGTANPPAAPEVAITTSGAEAGFVATPRA
jgi:hypothetical protein